MKISEAIVNSYLKIILFIKCSFCVSSLGIDFSLCFLRRISRSFDFVYTFRRIKIGNDKEHSVEFLFSNRCKSNSETHLEPYYTSLMELYCKNGYRLKAIFNFLKKSPIIDVWQGSKCVSATVLNFLKSVGF